MIMPCGSALKTLLLAMLVVAVAVADGTDSSGDVRHGEFSMKVPSSAAPQHASSGGPTLIRRHDNLVSSENSLLRREPNSTSAPALEEISASPEAVPSPLHKIAPFDTFDSDKSGILEKKEANSFLTAMGVPKDMWQHIDHDGSIDKVVFERLMSDTDVFAAADTDASGFLEANEVTAVMMRAGITQVEFDWHSYDFDKDGKLSKAEFLVAGPSAAHAAATNSQSLLEEWSDEDPEGLLSEEEDPDHSLAAFLEEDGEELAQDEDADDDSQRADDLWVMKDADKDGSSFLEIGEMDDLIHKAGIPTNFEWKSYDVDQDGKLSKEEWLNVAEVVKHQASPEFRNAVRHMIGEAEEHDEGSMHTTQNDDDALHHQ